MDPLLDDSIQFAKVLAQNNIDFTIEVWPTQSHGFLAFIQQSKWAAKCHETILRWLEEALNDDYDSNNNNNNNNTDTNINENDH